MKIRYTTNGVESHVQPSIGKELVKAGIAVEVARDASDGPPPPPRVYDPSCVPQPEWSVGTRDNLDKGQCLAVVMRLPNAISFYTGTPQGLNDRVFGRPVPKEIREEYTKRWKGAPGLRGAYDPRPGEGHAGNQKAAEELAEANRKLRERAANTPRVPELFTLKGAEQIISEMDEAVKKRVFD